MAKRITEDYLAEALEEAKSVLSAIESGRRHADHLAILIERLVAELRRLRILVVELVDPDPHLGARCPRHEGRCWWCAAPFEGERPHKAGCPWALLEQEARAIIEGGDPAGRG